MSDFKKTIKLSPIYMGKNEGDDFELNENIANRVISTVISKMPKGVNNLSRGMGNEIIGDSGFAYNTKSKKNGNKIIG